MQTEEVAKTKRCPFMPRVDESILVGGGFSKTIFHPAACVGSDCMMWRWKLETHYANAGAHVSGHSLSKTEGYCGLGGMPSIVAR